MHRTRVLRGVMAFIAVTAAPLEETLGSEAAEAQPSLELLEYLADMVADEEGWVGPGDFQQYVIPDQIVIYDDNADDEGAVEDPVEDRNHE